MSDDSSHLTWYDDLPVREIQENIAKLDDDPRASRLSHEQRVTLVYESAIARVLLEQCERYDDLRSDIEFDGESFELLRTLALERARVIAELFLSAPRGRWDRRAFVPGRGAARCDTRARSAEVVLRRADGR
jgi:hypothetical protein